jgi:hypothetical protein
MSRPDQVSATADPCKEFGGDGFTSLDQAGGLIMIRKYSVWHELMEIFMLGDAENCLRCTKMLLLCYLLFST